MDLSLSEEQTLFQNSVQKFIADNYDLSTRRTLCASDEGFSRENWKQFAELGWLAIPFSEEDGGFGGSPADTMILMEEFGKGLVVEPYLATVVMVGTALARAGTPEQKAEILGGIIEGNILATFAYAEEQAHHELHNVVTSAGKDGDVYLINGTKSIVLNAQSADKILVSTRTNGNDRDTDGITLFLVDGDAEGISRQDYPTVDGLRASEVTFKDVRVSPENILGEPDHGYEMVEKISDHAILALSAEAVGAMEVLYTDTIAYTKQREQFGHPLSDFQVLKHRMTEMFMEHSLSKSLCMKATMLECQGSDEAKRAIHALKVLIGKSSRFVSQNAVQLHGGMGMTEELAIAHYFKRLAIIDSQFGNVDHHLTKFVDI
ncbi:MAG: acyl-CoA dehydrogenase family protein [Pseudomonadales bacterium]|jgi:alkylation response protein AidB-like acyl-CoA dehydrogenase|nr:acyl-CoA dehydrogenase family protein [Pseudomonadales bacterium]MDP7356905.1 acyl-CoA dehydrogenase family protein [Pseudomonadales bacterium]MDP7595997.1 acyl-CoA dehydrogenase family protein [Pseudomonadales bacterium]HJN52773.1 acyl-CoA dehydrogenase family protein [Pseudomonadales bacterium]|tara:strand:+ start:577 stop:1704 length:1128 start_codon:yes stop_codon:yes gene_type:complete